MGVLESEASKLGAVFNTKHELVDVNHLIHTDIDPLKRDYPNLAKYKNVFTAIDMKVISKLIDQQLTAQLEILESSCVNSRGVKFDKMKNVHIHIMDNISKEDFNKLIDENVEDYSLFRANIYPLFFFLILCAIYNRDYKLLFKVYLVYGIWSYSGMFKKYFKNCSPELMNSALAIAHKSSLFANKYKEGSHTELIEYIIITEINKMVNSINTGRLTPTSFSRSISYIKNRFNQTLKNFANNAYYKVMNDDSIDQSIDMQHIHVSISNALTVHSKTYKVEDTDLNKIFYQLDLPPAIRTDTFKLIRASVAMNTDKRFIEQLRTVYTKLIIIIFEEKLIDICSFNFFAAITKVLNSRGKSIKVNELKATLTEVFDHIIESQELKIETNVRSMFFYRILFARYLYLFYIKPGNC